MIPTTEEQFEDEVRRFARLLWPAATYSGATMETGRERDGIFETEDFVNILECTVSRLKIKAEKDCDKIDELIRKLSPRHKFKKVRGWFVTLHEPTAEQRAVVNKSSTHQILACSFDQFRSRLVDARAYLDLREKYAFGSVRDPQSDSPLFDPKYIELDLTDDSGKTHSIESVSADLAQGTYFILTGDYGAGKSSTARRLFFDLAKSYWDGNSPRFPVFLNLRDHHGQTDPVEALERHARKLGFQPEDSLVRAWRAGLVILFLDGFDEIASAGWAGRTAKLKDLRYRSMELVRSFIRETPRESGVFLSGRAYFFDSDRELRETLAADRGARILTLNEFSTAQIALFLERYKWSTSIPEWLPGRPLLLSYLGAHELLAQATQGESALDPVVGWNQLLDRISKREAQIEAGIDPQTVRRLLEHLATLARNSIDGLGPLTPDALTKGFREVCGYAPDDRGAVLLQRLPGLGASQSEDGSRTFIDRDFAQACQGGSIYCYITDPYTTQLKAENWQSSLDTLGYGVAMYRCKESSYAGGKVQAALEHARKQQGSDTLCADLSLILRSIGASYTGSKLFIREVLIPVLSFEDESDFSGIQFQDCVIQLLELETNVNDVLLPELCRCLVARTQGRTGRADMPAGKFIDCTFDIFDNPGSTTNAILSLQLPPSTKVLLTVLKKIFAQSGSGRKESALFRGLDAREQQLIPPVLKLLVHENFIVKLKQGNDPIWLPTRLPNVRKRALTILAAPSTSIDSLVLHSKEISESA